MTSRRQRSRIAQLPLFAFSLAPLMAAGLAHAAPVLPTGGKVGAGAATIGAPSDGAMTITQTSGKAIINWQGFSIGQGGTVQFNNGSGATLNRVTGTGVSSIDGLLKGTGSVYVINPNGVIIGKAGVVNVGGTFVASTLDVADKTFLAAGSLSFTGASTASVVNLGKVGALGGDIALIAMKVENDGALSAPNGTVGLAAGTSVILRDAALDDGKFAVLVGGSGTSATNAGLIEAANAELKAEGGNVYALAGDTAGVIRATGVKSGDGHIRLVAQGGETDVAGVLDAQGANGSAGAIETSGETVKVAKASINAHGGLWTLDPTDLTIDQTAADTISSALNSGTDVTESTNADGSTSGANGPGDGQTNTTGAGDINVEGSIRWSTTNMLTLSAYRDINITGDIAVNGGGGLTLITDNAGVGVGALRFNGGSVQLVPDHPTTGLGSLYIGSGTGAPIQYTVIGNVGTLIADLQADANAGVSGFYALGGYVDNNGDELNGTPIGRFSGVIEGLGNSINEISSNPTSGDAALIAENDGVLRDFAIGGAISAGPTSSGAMLAVLNKGSIVNVSAYGTVSAGLAGGLVATNAGSITNSYSDVNVSGQTVAGGLAARNLTGGTIGSSTADNSVAIMAQTGGVAGGLVGDNAGTISGSSASGEVSGGAQADVGGLVGDNEGSIAQGSQASGPASTGADGFAGGLVGYSEGAITNAFATGEVTGGDGSSVGGLVGRTDGTVQASWGLGLVTTGAAGQAGGLAGVNGGQITDSYAASSDVVGGEGSYVGGLVGLNNGAMQWVYSLSSVGLGRSQTGDAGGLVGLNNGDVANAYAAGRVAPGPSTVGGLFGENTGFGISNTFFDTDTTGQSAASGYSTATAGAGSMGLTSAQFSDPSSPIQNIGLSTIAGHDGFVIVDTDGGLNGANGAAGATRPMLLAEYATTISNAHQLQLIDLDLTAHYTLANDIDASGTGNGRDVWVGDSEFQPIGGPGVFAGSLDGQGHTVSNIFIDESETGATYAGLFGAIGPGASVSNLHLENASVYGADGGYTGALAGALLGTVTGVSVSDSYVQGGQTLGGLTLGGLIGLVSGGGVVSASSLSNSQVDGGSASRVGGVVGWNFGQVTSVNVDVNSQIGGADQVGGLIGDNAGGLTNSQASAVVGGQDDVGGAVGSNEGTISAVAVQFGTPWRGGPMGVFGGSNVGGGVGFNAATGVVSDVSVALPPPDNGGGDGDQSFIARTVKVTSFSNAPQITAEGNNVGGLVGWNQGQLNGSLSNAVEVSTSSGSGGSANVGGLVGLNQGTIGSASAPAAASNTADVTGSTAVGGMIGWNDSSASVWLDPSSQTTGNVTIGQQYGGGLIGVNYGTISGGAFNGGSVQGDGNYGQSYLGGYVGWNAAGSITGGSVHAYEVDGASEATGDAAGGFAGWNSQGASLNSVTADVTVNGAGTMSGGLVGANLGAVVASASAGTVNGADIAGGLVGYNAGSVTKSSSSAAVEGRSMLGGLVGYNDAGAAIDQSYATGKVTGYAPEFHELSISDDDVGGLVGVNYGQLSNVYATGAVNGVGSIGGLVGANQTGASVASAYATGPVRITAYADGSRAAGALFGANDGALTNVYWFKKTSQQISAAGFTGPDATGQAVQLTATQANDPSSYQGFDGSIWSLQAGAPPTLTSAATPPTDEATSTPSANDAP